MKKGREIVGRGSIKRQISQRRRRGKRNKKRGKGEIRK